MDTLVGSFIALTLLMSTLGQRGKHVKRLQMGQEDWLFRAHNDLQPLFLSRGVVGSVCFVFLLNLTVGRSTGAKSSLLCICGNRVLLGSKDK